VDILLVRDWFWLWTYHFGDPSKGSLNRPERKLLPRFNARILKVNQIKVTVVTRTGERFVLCEDKGLVGTAIFRDSYSNNHTVLIAQPLDCQNFCGNGGHWSRRSTFNAGGGLAKSRQLKIYPLRFPSFAAFVHPCQPAVRLISFEPAINWFQKSANV
jgi:hypothetical protein